MFDSHKYFGNLGLENMKRLEVSIMGQGFDGIEGICCIEYYKNSKRKKRFVVKLGGSVQIFYAKLPSGIYYFRQSIRSLFFCGRPTIITFYGLVRYRLLHWCIGRGDSMEMEVSKRFSQ